MKKIFLTIVICILTFLSMGSDEALARDPIGIVAVVNDDVITGTDLSQRIDMVLKSSNIPRKKGTIQRMTPQILNSLIEERLQLQAAEELGLEITDAEINQAITGIAQQNKLTVQQFSEMLKYQNIAVSTIVQQVQAQIAWNKVVGSAVRSRIDVTEADVDARVQQKMDANGREEFFVAEIFLPINEGESVDQVRALAQKLYDEMRSGKAKFPQLAQQFSKGAGVQQGGVLGWVQEGQLADTVEVALKQMSKNKLSPPIKSDDGYHIVHLGDRRKINVGGEDTNMLVLRAEIANEIGQERLEMQARRYLRDLKASALIEYRV